MGTVLGLSFYFHDSAAALVRDGRIVAAVAEERFCRRKHTNEFPKQSIEYCLAAADLRSIDELDAIVFYEKPLLKMQRIVETLVAVWPRGLGTFTQRLPNYLAAKFNIQRTIEQMLPGFSGQILFSEHHASHAASAFYCSPFEEAAILTIDGVGEWETTVMGKGEGRHISLDRAIHFPHSIGLLYSALTSYLGFRVNDGEWKVMGLAPYGEPEYVEPFRKLVAMKPDGSFRLNMDYFVHHYSSKWTAHAQRWQQLFGFPALAPGSELEPKHENLARSGQVVVEELILNLARAAAERSGSRNLVLAGGVALNSVANWKIESQRVFDRVWIQPAAGDDGGALGAALLVSQELLDDPPCEEMTHTYWGPSSDTESVQGFFDRRGVGYERLDETALIERTADLLAAGKVVGWFQGRMEFGPRSLGSRSILADPTDAKMKDTINRKIKYREYFRPFAPAVPLEHVHEYFDVEPGTSLPFMLKVPPVRADRRDSIPAVTHADGSGRVQTVTLESNPRFHRLLQAFGRRRGVPVLINTSFNVRGEPIVCSVEDAYRCFLATGIDVLVVGDCIVIDKPADAVDPEVGYARSDGLEADLDSETGGPAQENPLLLSSSDKGQGGSEAGTQARVLSFYQELPFNYYSNALDTANQLMRADRLREYPPLRRELKQHVGRPRVLDVGCGAGWWSNSAAHHYGASVVGIDLNRDVLDQARAVARLMPGCEDTVFERANVFDYEPGERFDVVNSLGVLHHTPDCHGAIRRVLEWVAPGGHLHLGLYHSFGRAPFLEHFAQMQREGASEQRLFDEFARLNPDITDATHLRSWFRDQVLHPHETQHSYDEIRKLLEDAGFAVERTSINRFGKLPSATALASRERKLEARSRASLAKGRYFPGFFVVWARHASEGASSAEGGR